MFTHITIPENIAAVVLDLDGTIYCKPQMALYMFAKQWRHLPSLIAERRWRKAQRKALREGTQMPPMPVTEHWYRTSYLPSMVDVIAKHYKPVPWLQQLMDECRQRQIPVLILSDYEAVADKLRVLGLQPEAFDAILASADYGTLKPDTKLGEILATHISKNAAVNWQQVLFVGDRQDTDGQLAQALGAQFILVQS
ncbi:MAG: HAD family hydrolase [Paludibacteraceae bacterium]|nr:HAD family hydrolase [Paludibacteraceae bacterium]